MSGLLEKKYTDELELCGLDYENKRKIVNDTHKKIFGILDKEGFEKSNIIVFLINEILKNSADHTDSNVKLHMNIKKDPETKRGSLYFKISDKGSGFSGTKEEIKHLFRLGKKDNWEKKGPKNYGAGLGIIKSCLLVLRVDLIIHNKGKIIHINDVGLQKNIAPDEKEFIYEGKIEDLEII